MQATVSTAEMDSRLRGNDGRVCCNGSQFNFFTRSKAGAALLRACQPASTAILRLNNSRVTRLALTGNLKTYGLTSPGVKGEFSRLKREEAEEGPQRLAAAE